MVVRKVGKPVLIVLGRSPAYRLMQLKADANHADMDPVMIGWMVMMITCWQYAVFGLAGAYSLSTAVTR